MYQFQHVKYANIQCILIMSLCPGQSIYTKPNKLPIPV